MMIAELTHALTHSAPTLATQVSAVRVDVHGICMGVSEFRMKNRVIVSNLTALTSS